LVNKIKILACFITNSSCVIFNCNSTRRLQKGYKPGIAGIKQYLLLFLKVLEEYVNPVKKFY